MRARADRLYSIPVCVCECVAGQRTKQIVVVVVFFGGKVVGVELGFVGKRAEHQLKWNV